MPGNLHFSSQKAVVFIRRLSFPLSPPPILTAPRRIGHGGHLCSSTRSLNGASVQWTEKAHDKPTKGCRRTDTPWEPPKWSALQWRPDTPNDEGSWYIFGHADPSRRCAVLRNPVHSIWAKVSEGLRASYHLSASFRSQRDDLNHATAPPRERLVPRFSVTTRWKFPTGVFHCARRPDVPKGQGAEPAPWESVSQPGPVVTQAAMD